MIGNCYIIMWILIISLVLLGVIALIAGIIRNKRLQKKIERGELDRMPEVKEVDTECCGQHEVCERDSLLAAVSKKIEYYDDEELDQFMGREGMRIQKKKQNSFGMYCTPPKMMKWPDGCAAYNFVASNCRTSLKMKCS